MALFPGIPACSRAGQQSRTAPYLQHSPQCSSGPRHTGLRVRRRGSPRHGCEHPPSALQLPSPSRAVVHMSVATGHPARAGDEQRGTSTVLSLTSCLQGCLFSVCAALHTSEPHRNYLQRHKQSLSARDAGRFIGDRVELRQSKAFWYLPSQLSARDGGGATVRGSLAPEMDLLWWPGHV